MLFDLRSPGRRAAIKVIYATLAVLMGAGLLLFGIGGSGQGILDSLGVGGGGGGSTSFDSQIDDAQAKVDENPRNQKALVDLVVLNLQAGNSQLEIDQNTGQPTVTSDAEDHFNSAADAWAQYLKLHPSQPDSGAALQMSGAFFLLAQSATTAADAQLAVSNAADAQRVAAEQNPSTGNLNQLALYLYLAGKFQEGDGAAARAVAKAPASQREGLRKQLDQIKQQAKQFQTQVKAEAKSASAGGSNPLEQGGGGLSGGGLGGGGSLSTP